MFNNKSNECVEFQSTWKNQKYVKDNATQTKEIKNKDFENQSISTSDAQVQTEVTNLESASINIDNSTKLLSFLKKIEPKLILELSKKEKNHAFDDYVPKWTENNEEVKCLFKLQHSDMLEQISVSGLSWNSTGSVIAVSYGKFDHEDWCTHKSILCTWNIDRRTMDVNKPDFILDQPCCLMAIAYHPILPSIIAGGTFNGEVLVFDLSRENDIIIASSGIGEDSHRDPVSSLIWIPEDSSFGSKYNLVSIGNDGRILVWNFNQLKKSFVLFKGFALLTKSLPRSLKSKVGSSYQMGVTCIDFDPSDYTSFYIGSDSGGIYKCSTLNEGRISGNIPCSVPLHNPVTLSYNGHDGPVYSLHVSPFVNGLFLSSSSDGSLHLYTSIKNQAVTILECSNGSLFSAQWSPGCASVFAVGTLSGHLLIYDLKQSSIMPVFKADASENSKWPVYALAYNKKRNNLLASGDGNGCVMIWKCNDQLTQPDSESLEVVNQLVKQDIS